MSRPNMNVFPDFCNPSQSSRIIGLVTGERRKEEKEENKGRKRRMGERRKGRKE